MICPLISRQTEGHNICFRKLLFQPLRVAVCGNMVSPPLFESIELLSREDVLARIDYVTKEVFGG